MLFQMKISLCVPYEVILLCSNCSNSDIFRLIVQSIGVVKDNVNYPPADGSIIGAAPLSTIRADNVLIPAQPTMSLKKLKQSGPERDNLEIDLIAAAIDAGAKIHEDEDDSSQKRVDHKPKPPMMPRKSHNLGSRPNLNLKPHGKHDAHRKHRGKHHTANSDSMASLPPSHADSQASLSSGLDLARDSVASGFDSEPEDRFDENPDPNGRRRQIQQQRLVLTAGVDAVSLGAREQNSSSKSLGEGAGVAVEAPPRVAANVRQRQLSYSSMGNSFNEEGIAAIPAQSAGVPSMQTGNGNITRTDVDMIFISNCISGTVDCRLDCIFLI